MIIINRTIPFRMIVAAALTFVLCMALCVGYVAKNNWFGSGDISGFAFWSLFYSTFVAIWGRVCLKHTMIRRKWLRTATFVISGLLAGILMTFSAILILDGWFYAFSFPVPLIWMFAGSCGMVSFVIYDQPNDVQTSSVTTTATHSVKQREGGLKSVLFVTGIPIAFCLAMVAVYFLLLLGNMYIWNTGDDEIVLFPGGYTGPFLIVYDPVSGQSHEYEGSQRVYRIPSTRVLKTKFETNKGWHQVRFFYQEVNGSRKPLLDARANSRNSNDRLAAVFGGGLSTYGRGSSEEPGTVRFTEYIVATQAQYDTMSAHWSKLHDSILAILSKELVSSIVK